MNPQPKGDEWWIAIIALMIGSFLVGWALFGSTGFATTPSSFTQAQPPVMLTLASAQLLALTPTITVYPTMTSTPYRPIPTDTPTPVPTLYPTCRDQGLKTPCSIPAEATVPTPVPTYPACELLIRTTSTLIRTCQPMDTQGMSARLETQ